MMKRLVSPRPGASATLPAWRRALVAERDHVLAEDAAPALVPPTVTPRAFAGRISLATGVPPRIVESRSWLPPVKKMPVASSRRRSRPGSWRRARVEVQRGDAGGAELAEELLVARAGLVQPARGRDDDDVRVAAARDAHEAPQDVAIAFLVLGAADRDDPAACRTIRDYARHPVLLLKPASRTCRGAVPRRHGRGRRLEYDGMRAACRVEATRSASAPTRSCPCRRGAASRRVGREHRQRGLERQAGREQVAQRREQGAGAADVHVTDAPVGVEARQAAAAVRAAREARRRGAVAR